MSLKDIRFRSGLERQVAQQIEKLGHPLRYEDEKLPYLKPAKQATYTPDFWIPKKSGGFIIVETKGRFLTADRQKMLLIKDQYPDADIRMVFSNSKTRISKTSKTTYGMWCESKGIPYADRLIPVEWFEE